MIARNCLLFAFALLFGLTAGEAQGVEPAQLGVVGDLPYYKLSFYIVERAVSGNDHEAENQCLGPRTLAAAEVATWFDALNGHLHNKTISRPSVVVEHGRTAHLTVGAEQTFTVGYDADQAVTKVVPVGVRLTATPTGLDDGRVRVEFAFHIAHVMDVEHVTLSASPDAAPRSIELPTVFEQSLSSAFLLPVGGAAVVSGEDREADGKRHRTEVLVTVERFETPR